MIFLLPPLVRRMGHDRLAQGTLWVVRLHALLLIADSFFLHPVEWNAEGVTWAPGGGEFHGPFSLFGEPSFFAVYMGLRNLTQNLRRYMQSVQRRPNHVRRLFRHKMVAYGA